MNKNEITPLEELLDSLRDIEGFPIGKDEDILALSDPPYYTACPNPYINDFIKEHGKPYDEATDDYHREPFVGDVSEGKNDPIYMAHSYHTKVPYKAIRKYIEHYTKEEDIVFDGFCGTGMTGVAAQFTNRNAILTDISPLACFIAYNLNSDTDPIKFELELKNILSTAEKEYNWLYKTKHDINKSGKINYVIWSDVLICPSCDNEYTYWDSSVTLSPLSIKKKYECPNCGAEINKSISIKAKTLIEDKNIGKSIYQTKQEPVLINYSFNKKIFYKKPDKFDIDLLKEINELEIPFQFPIDRLPDGDKTIEPKRTNNYSHVHHFYTKRNLFVISYLFNLANRSKLRNQNLFTLTSFILKTGTKLHNIGFKNGRINLAGVIPNTIYPPSLFAERNIINLAQGKMMDIKKAFEHKRSARKSKILIQTCSSTKLEIPSNSIDYIFIDPPFGANLMYSELNYIIEAWLRIYTENKTEAIINNSQNKKLRDYSNLMNKSFKEFYRVLKPNRWITIEFHNTKSAVWNTIQDSVLKAGFIITQVTLLDKKQGTFNQMVAPGAVEKDLIITAYKPIKRFEEQFIREAGENLEIDFIKQFLENLP
ncbi:MAG: DNA methylase, partial [Candidatus Lokiarchaeota archaeon]|nr:DNA methylase [Candidatus Lokiarchaeota archaeon]